MTWNIDNTKIAEKKSDLFPDGEISGSGNIKGGGAATFKGAISGGTVGRAGGWFAAAACAGTASTIQMTNASIAESTGATTLPGMPTAKPFNANAVGDLWILFTVGTLKYIVPAWCASA